MTTDNDRRARFSNCYLTIVNSGYVPVTLKCCCLPVKLGKHLMFVTIFVYTIDETIFPPVFHSVGDWRGTKLNSRMLITFFHPEGSPIACVAGARKGKGNRNRARARAKLSACHAG